MDKKLSVVSVLLIGILLLISGCVSNKEEVPQTNIEKVVNNTQASTNVSQIQDLQQELGELSNAAESIQDNTTFEDEIS